MSPGQLGLRLLDELEEVSLDNLLQEIRVCDLERQASHLGIENLDQIFDIFRRPLQISPTQPRTSPRSSSDDEENYHDGLSKPSKLVSHGSTHEKKLKGKIIQLASSRSAAGKTSLLYYLSAVSVLPGSHNGNEAAVVWLDTDGRFSALRLAQLASHLLPARIDKAENDRIVQEALSHVHVFKPQSGAQLIETLKALPEYLFSRTQHYSQHRILGLVILDSATAFYWADRADAEIARLSNPGAAPPTSTSSGVIGQLRELEKSFSCTVLFTTDATMQRKGRAKIDPNAWTVTDTPLPPQNDQIFQDPWTSFSTLTLDVHRMPVAQFTPAMTVEGRARDQPRRIEAVRRGRHRAQVVWTGNESKEVREDVRTQQNGEGFTFRISSQGVDLE